MAGEDLTDNRPLQLIDRISPALLCVVIAVFCFVAVLKDVPIVGKMLSKITGG